MATNPFQGVKVPGTINQQELANAIRLDIEAELDAINTYRSHQMATSNKEARTVLEHIIGEEKQHADEFSALLKNIEREPKKVMAMTLDKSSRKELMVLVLVGAGVLGMLLLTPKH